MKAVIRPKPGEEVWIHSMGKRFKLTAVAVTVDAANAYMRSHDNDALIACFGDLNFIANKYEAERETMEDHNRTMLAALKRAAKDLEEIRQDDQSKIDPTFALDRIREALKKVGAA